MSVQGRVLVRISLLVPMPDNSMGHWCSRPQESYRAAAARTLKAHGDLPGSIPSDPAPLLEPRHVVLSDFGIGPHGERALARVKVLSLDVARSEATPVS